MATTYEARVTTVIVAPEFESLSSGLSISVRIEDDGAGEYVVICQDGKEVTFDPESWPALRRAISRIVRQCR